MHFMQDLVIPAAKHPHSIGKSTIFGFEAINRTTLLFFRGGFRDDENGDAHYSRGIRQKLRSLARAHNWKEKHAILIGSREELPGSYQDYLISSRFCLVAPGAAHYPANTLQSVVNARRASELDGV
jgi:hypothetical protein